jgi:FkbM family methyltransferase
MITAVAAKTIGSRGTVYSFEVDRRNFVQLRRTIGRNHLRNVHAVNKALSDRPRLLTFVRPSHSWGSFLMSSSGQEPPNGHPSAIMNEILHMGDKETYSCEATTLDEFVATSGISRIDLIKIDVDGPELSILKGALHTISTHHPALVVEVSMMYSDYGTSFEDVFSFLKSQQYDIFASPRTEVDIRLITQASDFPVNLREDRRSFNLICLPKTETDRRRGLWFLQDEAHVFAS